MFAFTKIYAVEILSTIMGVWLLWITVIYMSYFRKLKSDSEAALTEQNEGSALQKAREKRNQIYNMAVTYPSYAIFWFAVMAWGVSFLIKKNPL